MRQRPDRRKMALPRANCRRQARSESAKEPSNDRVRLGTVHSTSLPARFTTAQPNNTLLGVARCLIPPGSLGQQLALRLKTHPRPSVLPLRSTSASVGCAYS